MDASVVQQTMTPRGSCDDWGARCCCWLDEHTYFLGSKSGKIGRWSNSRPWMQLEHDTNKSVAITCLSGNQSGSTEYIASGFEDGALMVFARGKSQVSYDTKINAEGDGDPIVALAFHPEQKLIACGCQNGMVRIISFEADESVESEEVAGIQIIEAEDGACVAKLFWTEDNELVVAYLHDTDVILKNVTSGERLVVFDQHQSKVVMVDIQKNYAASVSEDKQFKVWDVASGKELFYLAPQ